MQKRGKPGSHRARGYKEDIKKEHLYLFRFYF